MRGRAPLRGGLWPSNIALVALLSRFKFLSLYLWFRQSDVSADWYVLVRYMAEREGFEPSMKL